MTAKTTWWAQPGPRPKTTAVCVERELPDGGVLMRRWLIGHESIILCPLFGRQPQLAYFAATFEHECSQLPGAAPPVEVKR